MGVEVVESDLASVDEIGNEVDASLTEDGNMNMKFGSYGADESSIGELNKLSEANLPNNAVDEWPEPPQIHSFYIVSYRTLEDQKLKAKLNAAEKELHKMNQARFEILEKLKTKRSERAQIRTQIHALSLENRQYRTVMDGKKKEMEPLQQALGKLRGPSGIRARSSGICSSEEELSDLVKSLKYRMQHESIPLREEKQILREIKQLEATREQVIANAAERAKIQDSLGEKEILQDQVKSMAGDIDGVRKEKHTIFTKIKQLDEGKVAMEKSISVSEEELKSITEKRDKILKNITEMRKQREEGNSPFYQYRSLLTKAKVLASNKDIDALKELSFSEVDKFMTLWNSNKALRDDYESRILQSLNARQLGRDGCIRNPGDKPVMPDETAVQSEAEVVRASVKQTPKEKPFLNEASGAQEHQVVKLHSAKGNKEGNQKAQKIDQEHKLDSSPTDKPLKASLPKSEELDEVKLKELKREEEKDKRRQAEERKKKLAEKKAAKAALKEQKEAEKKLKEREKRARKKTGAAIAAPESKEPAETDPVAEPEKPEESIEATTSQKPIHRKEHTIQRRARPRGPDPLPKTILKRKRAKNYWVWIIPAALALVVLLVLGYTYLS